MKKLQFTSKALAIASVLVCTVFISSCTENKRVRSFGGTQGLTLKANEKLLNITWKESNMWVLTEDTVTHIKYFRENSSWGVWEGEIIVL
jgi:hypothetical protein